MDKINITKLGHYLKKIRIIFQNFPKNVINDLYIVFSKLLCIVNKSNNLNYINHFLV